MNGNGNDNDEPPEDVDRAERSTPSGRRDSRPTPGTDPNLGTVFGGRYKVEEQIGVGGMGVVYRALHTGLGRDVVIKLLSRDHLDDEAAVERFEREARTLGRLDHSNIVTVYDFGYHDDVSYIVMEYVDGEQLDELVQREGPLSPTCFFPLAGQILDAVGQAHREGLVHRDLKPSNVMVRERPDRTDEVKVLDFGLAKLVSGENDVTKQDSLIGSMPYLSPEQIRGDDIDQRIDVYALGILFYFMLAGRKPFRGKNASILYDQVHSDPPPLQLHVPDPDAIPEGLYALITHCLNKDPADRPEDGHAALEILEAVAAEQSTLQMPNSSLPGPTNQAGAAASQSGNLDPREPSSSELLGKTSDTSDHVEVRRPSNERRPEPDPTGDPTQDLSDVDSSDSAVAPASSFSWSDPGTIVTLVASALAIGGTVLWFSPSFSSKDEDPVKQIKKDPEQASDAPPEIVLEQLRQVDRLVERDNIDGAEALLESVISTYDEADKLDEDISERQRVIHVAKLYRKARRAEANRNFAEAIDLLSNATKLDPSFRDASERLRRLENMARLRVQALEGVGVTVDGESVGQAPLEAWVEPGSHAIELRVDGETVWSDDLRTGKGETISLEPDLEDVDPDSVPSSSNGSGDSAPPPPDRTGRESTGDTPSDGDDESTTDDGEETGWEADDFDLVPN